MLYHLTMELMLLRKIKKKKYGIPLLQHQNPRRGEASYLQLAGVQPELLCLLAAGLKMSTELQYSFYMYKCNLIDSVNIEPQARIKLDIPILDASLLSHISVKIQLD